MPAPSVKQKLIAILAADAAGFSRLMSADEAATLTALDAARAVFRTQIERHQGRVIDMAGDSVLAVFETATGAVEAALQVQLALAPGDAAAPDACLRFRIGVHLGDVIEKHDGTVYGDGVNVASRLEGLAEAGGVVVSEAVRGVVGGRIEASFADRGPQRLKNIARPMRVFSVVAGRPADADATRADDDGGGSGGEGAVPEGERDAEGATRDARPKTAASPAPATNGSAAAPAPRPSARPSSRPAGVFVGRQAELGQLTKALRGARKGFGRVVLLAGSGGMGKTRLTQQLALAAEEGGTTVLWGRCLEEAGAPAYWPWRQLIRGYLRSGVDADPRSAFGAGLADIAGIVPEVAERFAAPSAAAIGGDDSAPSRFRLFDAVTSFWRRAAQRRPLLLIFEDLHWADATSLRLFAFLAGELDDSALLVLGTYRDTELSRQHPLFETLSDLARSPVCERIELKGLSVRETEQLMVAASGNAADPRFVSALHTRTEGHPLFLEETLRYMIDTRTPAAPDAADDEARWLTKIPTGVREVIGKRLNRLSPPAGRLLSVAACIGRDFELPLLAELEADKSEDELLQALEEALAEHLIEATGDGQQFRFGHALIRETLYDEMLGLRRARLHLRIGNMLEQRHGGDQAALWPQLAYHFSEAAAGDAAGKALDYAERAAGHAARLLAFEEAARLYRLALQLLQRHFAADPARRCTLLLALSEAELWFRAPEATLAGLREAADLARRSGLKALFGKAAADFAKNSMHAAQSGQAAVALLLEAIALHEGDDAMRVELLARLCGAYVYCDCMDEAMDAHRRAVALARRIDDEASLYVALASIASAGYWPGLLQLRLAASAEAWAIAGPVENVLYLVTFFACDLVRAGEVERLARVLDEARQVVAQRRAHYFLSVMQQIEALAAIGAGRFDAAEASAAAAFESGRRVGEDKAVGAYGMLMFCLRREQGRLREALPMLQQFIRDTPRTNHWSPGLALLYAELEMADACRAEFDALPWHRATLPPTDGATMTILSFVAEVCVYLGDTDRAAQLYGLLHSHAGANLLADSSGPCLGSTDRLLGSLATVMRRWDVAERHFEAALAMDARTGWRVWLAHTRHRYAVMLRQRGAAGDTERARRLLTDALADSSALGMQALTPRIEALIATLAAPPPPAWPCGLTAREVGVLRLMAIGRNNREIAQVLEISPNTVANHVRSILEKTYTANRTEAAAFASREGLLSP